MGRPHNLRRPFRTRIQYLDQFAKLRLLNANSRSRSLPTLLTRTALAKRRCQFVVFTGVLMRERTRSTPLLRGCSFLPAAVREWSRLVMAFGGGPIAAQSARPVPYGEGPDRAVLLSRAAGLPGLPAQCRASEIEVTWLPMPSGGADSNAPPPAARSTVTDYDREGHGPVPTGLKEN